MTSTMSPNGENDSERGAALLVVIGVGAVLALLMTLLVAVSVSGIRQAVDDSDWNAALAAAYAGVDEYQSRLSADGSYFRFGNPASTFSATSTVSIPTPANPAFGLGTAGTWATVSGSSNRAQFRYEVDNSTYTTAGRIRVRSTGKVGDATRTITADLKQQGFIDFLYFTDYEVQDPALVSMDSDCYSGSTLMYAWSGRPTGCNEVSFTAFDTINGPVHSNDTIRACGTTFTSTVTTANNVSPYYTKSGSGSGCNVNFQLAGYPAFSGGVIGMPATNAELKKETRTDLPTDVVRPGCLYTGPTQMTFTTDGKVNIKSPFTKKTRIGNAAATAGSTPVECGTITALNSTAGATITVPDNNVLYVQNVPSTSSDVNYTASNSTPANFTCTSSGSNRGWTFGTGSYPAGYPVKTSSSSSTEIAPNNTTYGCRTGDVFVKGIVDGAATIAAENYIFVVGDVTYEDEQDDILGLVGNNAVWVWNPLNSSGDAFTPKNRTIEAAILSVAHTFQAQNFDKDDPRGTLTILGAIAQKYRGTVTTYSGTTISTGYAKNYVYDERFKYRAPPKFLNPITTSYGVTSWVESAPVFSADGSSR